MPEAVGELSRSTSPIPADRFGYQEARHLLWRAGFGGTPEQIRTLVEWGPEESVDRLLDFSNRDEYPHPGADAFERDIMKPPTEAERRAYRIALRNRDEDAIARFRNERQRRQRLDRRQIRDMQEWWLRRMIETPRPLEEKLTLFWHGHFATSYRTIENSQHMYMQNRLFRDHAAGNVGDLLFRIIRDPAMLAYLDNDNNRRQSPNENLARELMELFSLGEGNYTERDIREGARALTGYTYDYNDFVFMPDRHDGGAKRILGARGQLDGDGFVKAILHERACSEFITYKLYRYFVRDARPDTERDTQRTVERFVSRLASTLRRENYELGPMLREMFLSEHFYHPTIMQEKIKSPVELIVGAVRSLRTPVRDMGILVEALGLMGQDLFFPPNVAGWSPGRSWINTSTLFVRQNILNFLLTGRTPTGYDALAEVERYDPNVILTDLERTDADALRDPQHLSAYLLRFMLGGEDWREQQKVLTGFVEGHGGRIRRDTILGMMALITTMPAYQLC